MSDAAQNNELSPLLEYVKAEGDRRRKELMLDTDRAIQQLVATTDTEIIEAHRSNQQKVALLEKEIAASTLGRAKWQADAVVQKRIGQAVSALLEQCRKGIDDFCETDEFHPFLEELICQAAEHAKQFTDEVPSPLGTLHVEGDHVHVAEEIIKEQKLDLDVVDADGILAGIELHVTNTSYVIKNTLYSRMDELLGQLRSLATKRISESLGEMLSHE
ncbi:hypothetical protein BVY04_02700 [bacterium M21]|nr:hypothetical protein BVY04_02700 [bacterium M21]